MELIYGMFLLVLRHVDSNEGVLVVLVQVVGNLLGQFRLPNPRRAEEEKDERMLLVTPTILLPTDCYSNKKESMYI